MRFFDVARKFADDGYHKALAYSHLARAFHALGNLERALESWYEWYISHTRIGQPDAAIQCLRTAITLDWNYWSIAVCDVNLDAMKKNVALLLDQMRDEQRAIAREALEDLEKTRDKLHRMHRSQEIADAHNALEQCEAV